MPRLPRDQYPEANLRIEELRAQLDEQTQQIRDLRAKLELLVREVEGTLNRVPPVITGMSPRRPVK